MGLVSRISGLGVLTRISEEVEEMYLKAPTMTLDALHDTARHFELNMNVCHTN